MKIREIFRMLNKNGWYVFKNNGKTSQLRHPIKLGIITITGHPSDKFGDQSLRNIFDLAGL